jgi:hypothetical protein
MRLAFTYHYKYHYAALLYGVIHASTRAVNTDRWLNRRERSAVTARWRLPEPCSAAFTGYFLDVRLRSADRVISTPSELLEATASPPASVPFSMLLGRHNTLNCHHSTFESVVDAFFPPAVLSEQEAGSRQVGTCWEMQR